MAAAYSWISAGWTSAGLSSTAQSYPYPQKGYTEEVGAIFIKTPMDSGISKMRRRSSKPTTLNLSYIMTGDNVNVLNDFIAATTQASGTGAVSRFDFPHPRTGGLVEARFVPQDSGTIYSCSYLAPDYYTITLQLEILP
jgi:hypothetical protein